MNTDDTCRLCLEKLAEAGSAVPLRDDSFQAAIKRVFPFEFKLDSNLPEYACSLCSQRVWKFNSFGEFVENNQRKLQQEHPVMQSADKAQKDGNSEQISSSIVDEARIVRDENSIDDLERAQVEGSTSAINQQFSCELQLDIEVGKYELQEQQNEESVSDCNGMDLKEHEAEHKLVFSIHNINQSKEGSKKDVAEKPKNTDSALESPKIVPKEASAGNAGRPLTPGDTADVRKSVSCEREFIGHIEINNNELEELEKEELERTNDIREPTLNVERITEHEESLKNTPKNIGTIVRTTFSCSKCKQTFTAQRQFAKHICREPLSKIANFKYRRSKGSKKKQNIKRKNSKQHIAAHEGAYRCDVCDQNLSSSWSLRNHQNTVHSDRNDRITRKKEKCPICAKHILQSALKRHIAAHEDAYLCDICGRNLSSLRNLRNHQNSVQCGEKNRPTRNMAFRCDVCDQYLSTEWSLRRHQKRRHYAQQD